MPTFSKRELTHSVWTDKPEHTRWAKTMEEVNPQIIMPYAMKAFKDNTQHFELHLESNWQSVQLM